MRSDVLVNLGLILFTYVLPCVFAPERFAHPSPWVAAGLGLVLLFSQPRLDRKEMVAPDADDRRSALGIYVGMLVPQLWSAWEFALRPIAPDPLDPWVAGGGLLAAGGLTFRVWAIRTLGRFFTSTVRVQKGQCVVDTGPYRLLRHPSYTGALGMALGTTLMFGSTVGTVLVFAVAVPAYVYRMGVEERTLARDLGEPYLALMRRTKRLIPFVY